MRAANSPSWWGRRTYKVCEAECKDTQASYEVAHGALFFSGML